MNGQEGEAERTATAVHAYGGGHLVGDRIYISVAAWSDDHEVAAGPQRVQRDPRPVVTALRLGEGAFPGANLQRAQVRPGQQFGADVNPTALDDVHDTGRKTRLGCQVAEGERGEGAAE